MSDDPKSEQNRPMHDLLNAYAKQRRAQADEKQAGEKPELHPVDRRLLQAEVSRQYPARDRSPLTGSWSWLRRLTTAFGMACLLAGTLWIAFQMGRPDPKPVEMVKQEYDENVAAPVAPPAARAIPAAPTPAPAAAPSPALAVAETKLKSALADADSNSRRDELAKTEPGQPARTPGAAAKDAGLNAVPAQSNQSSGRALFRSDTTRALAQSLGGAGAVQTFSETHARTQGLSPASPPQGNQGGVLTQFEFEQTGERVRVVDGDGSIYEGLVLSAPAAALAGTVAPANADAFKKPAPSNDAQKQQANKLTQNDAPSQAPQPLAVNFRVSGTNRTLQQPVQLDGVLMSSTETPPAAAAEEQPLSTTGAANAIPTSQRALRPQNDARRQSSQSLANQTGPQSSGAFRNAAASTTANAAANASAPANVNNLLRANLPAVQMQRIQGTLRIGSTNQIQIDAIRSGSR
jgi:hypothetical protein